jgi:phosphoglycolate phosphatase
MLNNNNKTIKGVLFDLDGTLLDTADDLGAALNFVLEKYSLPKVERERYRPIASDGALGLLNLGFGVTIKQYDYEQLRGQFLDYYENNIAIHTTLYEGVSSLLAKLDEQAIPWGIVTNKPEGLTRKLLPHYPEFNSCQSLIGGDTLAKRKPDPSPILHACKDIQVPPESCLYVGDALRDIQAGNAACSKTVIALWGYILADEDCSVWQADFLAKSPTEILSYI